jgi:hypothetical protein
LGIAWTGTAPTIDGTPTSNAATLTGVYTPGTAGGAGMPGGSGAAVGTGNAGAAGTAGLAGVVAAVKGF